MIFDEMGDILSEEYTIRTNDKVQNIRVNNFVIIGKPDQTLRLNSFVRTNEALKRENDHIPTFEKVKT